MAMKCGTIVVYCVPDYLFPGIYSTTYATSTVKYRFNTDFKFHYCLSAFCVLKSAWYLCSNNYIAVLYKWLFIVRTLQFSIYYCITCSYSHTSIYTFGLVVCMLYSSSSRRTLYLDHGAICSVFSSSDYVCFTTSCCVAFYTADKLTLFIHNNIARGFCFDFFTCIFYNDLKNELKTDPSLPLNVFFMTCNRATMTARIDRVSFRPRSNRVGCCSCLRP